MPDGSQATADDGESRGAGRWLRGWERLQRVPTPVIFFASVTAALVILWRKGSLTDVAAALHRLDPAFLVVTFALYLLGLGCQSLRWHALVRTAGGAPRPAAAADVFLTSVVVNYAAPIGLAVPTRAAFTARDLGLSLGLSGAVVIWEALLDVASLGLLGIVWVVLGGPTVLQAVPAQGRVIAVAVLVIVGVGLVALAAVASRSSRVRDRIVAVAGEVVRHPFARRRWAGSAVLLTALYWGLQVVILRRLLEAFGAAPPDLETMAGLTGLPVLLGMLSPVPGGAGIREALMVAVAQIEGMSGAVALLAAVVYRTALFVTVPLLYTAIRLWSGRGERRRVAGAPVAAARRRPAEERR